jgi:type IV secretory pathway VirB10-like protein
MADGIDVPPAVAHEPTAATMVTDLHRSKIAPDDPRLSIERPRSRTLRRGPVLVAVLGIGCIVAVALVLGFAASTNDQAAGKQAEPDQPVNGAAELPDVIRQAPVGSGGSTARPASRQFGEHDAIARRAIPEVTTVEPDGDAPGQAEREDLLRARAAGLFAPVDDAPIGDSQLGRSVARGPSDQNTDGAGSGLGKSALDPGRVPDANFQERMNEFLSKTGGSDAESLDKTISPPRSPYEVKAGTVIPTVLLTGINSDLPGQIIGQVRENIYDTVSGSYLLIPQGSRLIAAYDSMVAWGQERVLVCWNRLIRPDGSSLTLDCMPGVDLAGYSGFADEVDNHWWKIISGAAFSSLLAATAQRSQGDVSGFQPSVAQTWAGNAAGQINQSGQQLTQKNLQIQPTITVRPGFSVNVLVSKDIVIPPYRSRGTP